MPDFDYRTLPAGYQSYINPRFDPFVTQLRRVEAEGTAIRLKATRDTSEVDWRPEIILAYRNNCPEWQKLMTMMGYVKGTQPAPAASDVPIAAAYAKGRADALAEVRAKLAEVK